MHEEYVNPSVTLAASANHSCRFPNFPSITLKFKVPSLKENSDEILECASNKYLNKICLLNMPIKSPQYTSSKYQCIV